jgi:hypothetical protein
MNLNIQNNVEMKWRTKDSLDTKDKKIKLIENQTISTSYNMIADSLGLAPIRITARTTLFGQTQIQYSGVFDPYQVTSEGVRINKFQWNGKGPLLRDRSHNISVNLANLRGGQGKKGKSGDEDVGPVRYADDDTEVFADNGLEEELRRNPNAFVDFKLPWTLNLTYTVRINKQFLTNESGNVVDSSRVQQNVLFRGDIRILEKWKLGINSGYDFTMKELSPTTMSLFWDLHCWEFQANVIPFGERKSYNLRLGVKASVLQDLKIQRRRTFGNGEGVLF